MRTKLIVGITVVLGSVILFFLSGGGKGKQVFYMTPSEFLSSPAKTVDRVRLTGRVEKNSVKIADNKLDLNFIMGDGQQQIPIHYKGTIPEAFAEELEVVVDGRMAGGNFEGKEIIVKCPSKYESKLKEDEKKDK
jgi:cytochrome c-type biogenesis protein CcmE